MGGAQARAGEDRPLLAAVLLVVAGALFTAEAAFVRLLGERVSNGQILLFRASAQVLAAFALVQWAGGLHLLRTRRIGLHLLRGGLSAASWSLYYLSFRSVDLALATTLTFTTQIFLVALAGPILGERLTAARLWTTLVGFAGIVLASGVATAAFDGRIVYGLTSALCGAVMVVITRSLAVTERTDVIMAYMGLGVFLGAIPQAALDWRPIGGSEVVLLLLLSVSGTIGTWFMVEAYRRAEASALAPFPYLRLVWTAVIATVVFGEAIGPNVAGGALLIVASSLALVWSERRRARAARKEGARP